ncbi:MAG: 3-isopropylmalate dehydratase large subunit, partial [Bacillota bacterium]
MNCVLRHLSRAAGLANLQPGDQITAPVDLAFTHDGGGPATVDAFTQAGFDSVTNPECVMFCFDHGIPAPTILSREGHNKVKTFARQYGTRLYDKGQGVVHQVILEEIRPERGQILVGADGHVATAGGYGALAFSVKPSELAQAIHTGRYSLTVPSVVAVEIGGSIQLPLTAKDIILFLMGKFGVEGLKGRAVVFGGEAVTHASVADRMTICNMAAEAGAVTAYVPAPDEQIGEVAETFRYTADEIPLSVACPPNPGNVKPIDELLGLPIQQVIVGACSSGRIEDMELVVRVLKEAPVHPDVTMVVVPASRAVAAEMDRRGWSALLREQGAILVNPGCGPCSGTHQGVMAKGERVISTTTKNVPGRIGDKEAEIYLASPLVAATAAVHGAFHMP